MFLAVRVADLHHPGCWAGRNKREEDRLAAAADTAAAEGCATQAQEAAAARLRSACGPAKTRRQAEEEEFGVDWLLQKGGKKGERAGFFLQKKPPFKYQAVMSPECSLPLPTCGLGAKTSLL